MFQKEVFLVGCNVCFRSEYNFSVCTEEEEEKKGFFVSIIFRKIMPRSRFLFSRFTILVKTVLKKVDCRKQNPKKSKNRQQPKYNLICILILFMPNIVFSRTIFSSNLEWTEHKLWYSLKRPYSCPFIPNRTWNGYLYGEFPVYLVTVDRSSVQKISCYKARLKFIWHNSGFSF